MKADNSILVRRKPAERGGGLDGAFIYGKTGEYPDYARPLTEAITRDGDLSFAEIFVTDSARTPGTYNMLLKGMTARLALEGAHYSMGMMLEQNKRHEGLLLSFNHQALSGASVYLDDHGARFIPMLWTLP